MSLWRLIALTAVLVAAAPVLGACSRAEPTRGRSIVTRVVDGDTAVLEKLGKSRFIGVDTPEVYGRAECFGAQASAFAKRVLAGKTVGYEIGREPRDRYGRALVYIWLEDGRFFNEVLVSEGYARPLAIAPNVDYATRFGRRSREAREAGRGLWSRSSCAR